MKVVIAGGGTGGHFFPALAVAEELKRKGVKVYYIGSKNGIEYRKKDLLKGFETIFLTLKAVRGKGLKSIYSIFNLSFSTWKLLSYFSKIKPDKVLVFGGYASIPAGVCAVLKKIPLYLHEQNSVPGKTNLLLGKFAKGVFLGFKHAERYFPAKSVYTGNPLREELIGALSNREQLRKEVLKKFPLSPEKKTLLIFGGSQGALWINEKLKEVVADLYAKNTNFQLIHLTGGKGDEELRSFYKRLGLTFLIFPFYERMWELYSVSDAAVSRSGAMSVAELTAFGIPTLFIPYPFAVDDHQYFNVLEIYKKNGCFLKRQKDYDRHEFTLILEKLLFDIMTRKAFSKVMKNFSALNATSLIVEKLIDG